MKRALAAGLGSASAACVRTNLATGLNGPGSTVKVSSTSTCNDLNLTAASDHGGYEGYYYKSSTGTWVRGSRGYVYTSNFNASSSSGWKVLLSDIANGTRVGVASLWDSGVP